MILIIDNFDSFTYNIYQYLAKSGYDVVVKRNNEISLEDIEHLDPTHIIISPGPGNPQSAGISVDTIKNFAGKKPILGVCLGHQAIAYAFGAEIVRAKRLFHGKISRIKHDGKGVYRGLKQNFKATRYHSLVVKEESLNNDLIVTSKSVEDKEIMGIRHVTYDIEGVQFHPESIESENGYDIFINFVEKNRIMEEYGMKYFIKKVFNGENLTEKESEDLMYMITSGKATPAQISAILIALAKKGETVNELTGFVRVMRDKATKIKTLSNESFLDTCGTGGDSSGTFNISTSSAFVAASGGAKVAKHGNRSITSKCGSADVLEALGIKLDTNTDNVSAILEKIGISFLFAPNLHKSMKYAVPVRKEIGVRTVFNILGPMTNPAGAEYQVMGVFREDLVEKIANVLNNLGTKRAMIVHGYDGLDEITLTSKTKIAELNNGWIKVYDFDPLEYGFEYCDMSDLKGGNLVENKEILIGILDGTIRGPKRDIVVLNSAAALYVYGLSDSLKDAIALAKELIDSKKALNKLNEYIKISQEI